MIPVGLYCLTDLNAYHWDAIDCRVLSIASGFCIEAIALPCLMLAVEKCFVFVSWVVFRYRYLSGRLTILGHDRET